MASISEKRSHSIRDLETDIVSDIVDKASLAHDRALEAALASMRWQSDRQTEFAEARKKVGKYGICVDCEGEIPSQRLQAQPNAIRCVSCQEKNHSLYRFKR